MIARAMRPTICIYIVPYIALAVETYSFLAQGQTMPTASHAMSDGPILFANQGISACTDTLRHATRNFHAAR